MTDRRFISYAQNREDVMLWRALRDCGPGSYVDAGAGSPTDLSVTRAFYDRGWSGLNVEPLPEQAAALAAARPRDVVVCAALAEAPGPPRRFHRVLMAGQTGLSTLDAAIAERHRAAGAALETIEVPVTTLAALCRIYLTGPLHFLKLDVEGAEAAALAGMDFQAVRPWVLVIEAASAMQAESPVPEWEPGVLAQGYRHVWSDGLNRFYLADEQAALARHFVLPPNVFDDYAVYDPQWQQRLADAEASAERHRRQTETLEAALAAMAPPPAPGPPLPEPSPMMPSLPTLPAGPLPEPEVPRGASPLPAAPLTARRALRLLYAPVRPVVRPLARRFRRFMTIELQQELQSQGHRLDALAARPLPLPLPPPPPPPPPDPMRVRQETMMLAAIDALLVTLALQDARQPQPGQSQPGQPQPRQPQSRGLPASPVADPPPDARGPASR